MRDCSDRQPIPMVLHCPECRFQHVDAAELHKPFCEALVSSLWACNCSRWANPPHRTHLCKACGHLWKPANVPTTGVKVLDPEADRPSTRYGIQLQPPRFDDDWAPNPNDDQGAVLTPTFAQNLLESCANWLETRAQVPQMVAGETGLMGIYVADLRRIKAHLAAPLAVEDSRERCASSDARPLLDPAFPREGYVSDAEWAARQRGATQGDIYATRLRAVLEVVQRFLSPDGIDAEAAMGEIVGLVDPWPAAMAAASSGKEKSNG